MKTSPLIKSARCTVIIFLSGASALAWDPLPVRNDPHVFMPGSQQGTVVVEPSTQCQNCHGGYELATEPLHNWRGSMMAQAGRDPLWLACLAVAAQDSIWALGNPNAVDLCLRCHSPVGWLGGRSEPVNGTALNAGLGDMDGVNCSSCHRMVDPLNGLRQSPELPGETDPTGSASANDTHAIDFGLLRTNRLFDGSWFFNTDSRLPVWYGTNVNRYSEATSGQFFVDGDPEFRRGPRYDVNPRGHGFWYSRFHRTKSVCGACHDVSNPALAHEVHGAGTAERQAAASYFHVERTFSEFSLSAYARSNGAPVPPKLGTTRATRCQDCHMRRVTGRMAKQGTTRTDLALHDQSGGNSWMLGILATADSNGPGYDAYNYEILSGTKYPGARIDVAGLRDIGPALLDGQIRAMRQLTNAADLAVVADTTWAAALRITNNTGHKLISGFPEGRRMWLNVKFYNANGAIIGEINPYEALVIRTNLQGNNEYVSGGVLTKNRDDLVYEAEMASLLTGEEHTFHFVLATSRYKDNRIPPRGFDSAAAAERLVAPRWHGEDALDYFTAEEYAGGYDEVTILKPTGTAFWQASLYYQTTSKEYVEFLRNEINGSATSLSTNVPSGEPAPYIVQTDPFFASLKDWGEALWDLWLHNGGSPPVLMTSLTGPTRVVSSGFVNNAFLIQFHSLAGRTYQVQWRGDPTSGTWQDIGGPVVGDGSVKTISDSAQAESQRFYRLVESLP